MKLTKEQAIIVSGFTGTLCCEFSDFHEDIEKRLGRPVFTHEFGGALIWEKIREVYTEDFMAILPSSKKEA